jgi:hypothetical protein
MIQKRQILFTKTESGKLSHQYGITQPCIKTLSMSIVILVMDLVIKKYIVEIIQEDIIWGTTTRILRDFQGEITIHFLPWWITTSYVITEIILDI